MSDQQVFVRAFATGLEQTGPRQLTGRVVPYNAPARVADRLPDGNLDIYTEGFRAGAFAPQASSNEPGVLRRIGLVHTHEGGLGYLGPFVALRDEPDGLWGDVVVLRSKASDVEDLIEAGVRELSVEYRLPRTGQHTEVVDGVRWRTRAHLDRVAMEAKGAYGDGARVLAFREDLDELAREEDERREAAETAAAAADAKARAEAAAAEAAAERKRRWEAIDDEWIAAASLRQDELAARFRA